MEYRYLPTEVRATDTPSKCEVSGYAAMYNSESKDLGGFREVIAPGAFTRSLRAGVDVKCLFNHDPNQLLGRVQNGTLQVEADSMGLHFRCSINREDPQAMALHAKVKRGDVSECSFAFTVAKGGQQFGQRRIPGSAGTSDEDYYVLRTLTDVDLLDVSAVTTPAYNETSLHARKHFDDIKEVRGALAAAQSVGKLPIVEFDTDELVAYNQRQRSQFFADLQDRARILRGERPLQAPWKPSLQ